MNLSPIDIAVIVLYAVSLFAIAQIVSREKLGHQKNTQDYFLASKSLPWWAVGASLIAANISAEQIIGMSGSGFAIGLAIASYEWMSAITIIIVGKYFLPVFLKHGIFTMPQFLEKRYDHRVRTIMAVFWLGVYVFVNLTAILWLGALAINTVTGLSLTTGLIGLGVFAGGYSIYGGLKAVALTDIIQVVLLVLGGLFIAYITLDTISGGLGPISGFMLLMEQAPDKFDMILSKDSPHFASLPGISVLVGGMWVMNLSYWGFNQYIIQRALAAKNIREAQKGIVFAAFLKILMPLIVVLPGIAAVILAPDLASPDQAYPEMMKLMPVGLLGLVFAALLAAIVSSLGSMVNSISTIFTLDLYSFYRKGRSEEQLVRVGRITSIIALILAMISARPLLGNFDQAFQYIQEFTGFFTPGIVVVFLLGLFWPKASTAGALAAAIGSAVFSIALKIFWPSLPFMDRVGLVFVICLAAAVVISLMQKNQEQSHGISTEGIDFSTTKSFNYSALAVVVILCGLYAVWW